MLRPTWFEIDADAAAANFATVRRLVGPARKVFAVVKADAYGFGSVEMARVFVDGGADGIAVADADEGVRLRHAGVAVPILVYPNTVSGAAADVLDAGLMPTLTDLDAARAYSEAARGPVDVFVKVDVGLERLGVPAEQATKLVLAIRELPRLRLAGLCTHLHTPARNAAYVEWQFSRFTAVLDALASHGVVVPIRLAASSPLVLGFPDTYLNAVDPGAMLYGIGRSGYGDHIPLRPAFGALKTRLIEVKELSPRDRFADLAPFPIAPGQRLGVIPIGAGDGFHRLDAGAVLVRGRRAPILARPSLEHTRVDLSAVPGAAVGDEVVLVGGQGGEAITVDEVASRHALEPHHVALAIGPRVTRLYVRGGASGAAPA